MIVKPLMVICCIAVTVLASEKYTEKYDYINVEEILENERVFEPYYKCIMDQAPCKTAEAKELRGHMEDALVTGCEKCTEAQKKGATTVIEYLISKKIDMWKELCAKYDPEGVWRKKYEDLAKEKGIVIPKD